MRTRWGAGLLLALTAIIMPLARSQTVQDPTAADDVFDTLVYGITACKTNLGANPVSRIACILEQVH